MGLCYCSVSQIFSHHQVWCTSEVHCLLQSLLGAHCWDTSSLSNTTAKCLHRSMPHSLQHRNELRTRANRAVSCTRQGNFIHQTGQFHAPDRAFHAPDRAISCTRQGISRTRQGNFVHTGVHPHPPRQTPTCITVEYTLRSFHIQSKSHLLPIIESVPTMQLITSRLQNSAALHAHKEVSCLLPI